MIFFTNNKLHKGFGLTSGAVPPKEEAFHAKIEEIRKWREANNYKLGSADSGTAASIIATSSSSSGHKAVTHMDTRPTFPARGWRNAGPPSQVHRFQAATTGPSIQASNKATHVEPEASQSNAGPKAGHPQFGTSSLAGKKAVTHVTTKPAADPDPQVQTNVQPSSSGSKAVSRPVNTKSSGPSLGLNLRPQVQAAATNVQAWSKAVSRPVGNANAGPQAGQLQAGTVQALGNNAMTPGSETTPNTHDDPNAPSSFSDPILDPKPKLKHVGFGHNLNEPDPVHAKNRRIIHNGFGHNLREEGVKKEDQDP